MKYAFILDGVVAEIIEPYVNPQGENVPLEARRTPEFVASCVPIENDAVGLGWHYDGVEFSPPPPAQSEPAAAPSVVTMRQARLALLAAGMLDDVEDAVDATGDPAARIEWDYATTVDRASPFTQQLAAALGLDDAALDALFTQAAAL